MPETWVWSLGQEDSLEKGMATHSSILAWRIPWTEEPGRLQSMGSQKVRHDWATFTFTCCPEAGAGSSSRHLLQHLPQLSKQPHPRSHPPQGSPQPGTEWGRGLETQLFEASMGHSAGHHSLPPRSPCRLAKASRPTLQFSFSLCLILLPPHFLLQVLIPN